MFGIFNVDKPAGLTSRDVVNRIQRHVRPHKCGHAGTLDPLATGVLLVCVGPATRLIEYLQQQPKQYVAQFLLGRHSDTEDVEGQVEFLSHAPQPSADELAACLPEFLGTIQQVPPAYSALKIKGQRAYDLARRGTEVTLSARPVEIHRLTLLRYAYPELELEISCGSGTYIRSLGRDLARRLGTEAVMSALRRTAIGAFAVTAACHLDALETEAGRQQHLQSPRLAVKHLAQVTLSEDDLRRLARGELLPDREACQGPPGTEWAGCDEQGNLQAILTRHRSGRLRPLRNFAAR